MPTRVAKHNPFPQRIAQREVRDYRAYDATRAQDPDLLKAKKIRSSRRWRAVREYVLRRQPLCADPFGRHAKDRRIVPATEVDHILGLRTHPHLAFTTTNLQALCTRCHARKSGQERAAMKGDQAV